MLKAKGEGLYKITRKGAFDFAQEELWVVAKEKKDKKGQKRRTHWQMYFSTPLA